MLVADADPTVWALAGDALRQDGHDVIVAATAEEAWQLFDARVPDIVLLDSATPVLDGHDACVRLRSTAVGARIPILMLTGSDDAEAIGRAYDAGATDFQTQAPERASAASSGALHAGREARR